MCSRWCLLPTRKSVEGFHADNSKQFPSHYAKATSKGGCRNIGITLIHSSEFASFHECKRFLEGFQHFLAFRFFQEVHRQTLKPSLDVPPAQLSPISAELSGDYLGGYSAARMRLSFVIHNAVWQLLRRIVLNRNVNEATRTKTTSRGERFAVPYVVSRSFQMRATMDSVAPIETVVGVTSPLHLRSPRTARF